MSYIILMFSKVYRNLWSECSYIIYQKYGNILVQCSCRWYFNSLKHICNQRMFNAHLFTITSKPACVNHPILCSLKHKCNWMKHSNSYIFIYISYVLEYSHWSRILYVSLFGTSTSVYYMYIYICTCIFVLEQLMLKWCI